MLVPCAAETLVIETDFILEETQVTESCRRYCNDYHPGGWSNEDYRHCRFICRECTRTNRSACEFPLSDSNDTYTACCDEGELCCGGKECCAEQMCTAIDGCCKEGESNCGNQECCSNTEDCLEWEDADGFKQYSCCKTENICGTACCNDNEICSVNSDGSFFCEENELYCPTGEDCAGTCCVPGACTEGDCSQQLCFGTMGDFICDNGTDCCEPSAECCKPDEMCNSNGKVSQCCPIEKPNICFGNNELDGFAWCCPSGWQCCDQLRHQKLFCCPPDQYCCGSECCK